MRVRKWPGLSDYGTLWDEMKRFTQERGPATEDEIWLVEHAPVFTLGLAGKPEHVLAPGDIPVVRSDRGGQVTYHGPGQVVAYVLLDLRRAGYFVREYVARVEDAAIATLADAGLRDACRKDGAPGVYVPWPRPPAAAGELAKIAALGIKVHQGCTYHGLSFNVAMDLEPFSRINPCGYAGLRTVDLASCGVAAPLAEAGEALASQLRRHLLPSSPAPAVE